MVGGTLETLTVAFSLVSGTAAGLMSLLAWETLRRSPFGRAVFILSLVMVTFIGYHLVVLILDTSLPLIQTFKSTLFTGAAVFVWMMVWSQHRVRTSPVEGDPKP